MKSNPAPQVAQDEPSDPVLIGEERLLAWLKYKRRGDLERWLVDHQIPYRKGMGGRITTTIHALGAGFAPGAEPPARHESEFEFR